MKLAIATGIVATQSLPVISEESTSNDNHMDFAGRLLTFKDELLFTNKKTHQHDHTGTRIVLRWVLYSTKAAGIVLESSCWRTGVLYITG